MRASDRYLERVRSWRHSLNLKSRQCTSLFCSSNPPMSMTEPKSALGQKSGISRTCMKGARIGERCVIGQNVNVDGGASHRQQREDPEQRFCLRGHGHRRRRIPGALLRADQRHQSSLAGQSTLPLRDGRVSSAAAQSALMRRLFAESRLDAMRLSGQGLWSRGRAGLCPRGGKSGSANWLDEPSRPSSRQC